uniref:ParB-like N-terminal domain-containing protein n=1 Tax=viral metagenome TaxID=1070528 RepID=A0A6H1ZHE2_9ZZZZ
MKISHIKIKNRFRKDIGSLEELKNSIKELGLLQPIVIDEKNHLIAGMRRLLACKGLGMKDIAVNQIKIQDALRGEYDENVIRKNFTPSESVAIWEAMESYQFKRGCRSESDQPQPRKQASKLLGKSTDTLSKAKQVMEFGNKKLISEMDKTGNVSQAYQKVKKEKRIKEEQLGRRKKIADIEIRKGDFKKVLADLKNVDVIVTDPPYPEKYLDCFSDLSKFAKDKLKDDGFLIVYSGQYHLPEVIKRLSEHLTYVWTFCLYHSGKKQLVNGVNIMCGWKPVLIFSNGKKKMRFSAYDVLHSESSEKFSHKWQQSESGVRPLIEIFSKPGELVVDPFAGTGTFLKVAKDLGRRTIGADII